MSLRIFCKLEQKHSYIYSAVEKSTPLIFQTVAARGAAIVAGVIDRSWSDEDDKIYISLIQF